MSYEQNKKYVDAFSPHLFWDVKKDQFSITGNESFLVQRVLEYGLLKDWELLKRVLGLDKILSIAKNLRSLEPKALAYLSVITDTPLNEFRCYTSKPSIHLLLNY